MKPINVETLMGHSTGISDHYYRPTEKEFLEDYLKAVPLLTISEVEEIKRESQLSRQELEERLLASSSRSSIIPNETFCWSIEIVIFGERRVFLIDPRQF